MSAAIGGHEESRERILESKMAYCDFQTIASMNPTLAQKPL